MIPKKSQGSNEDNHEKDAQVRYEKEKVAALVINFSPKKSDKDSPA